MNKWFTLKNTSWAVAAEQDALIYLAYFFCFTKLISFGSIAVLLCKNPNCLWGRNVSINSNWGIGVHLHHQETVLCTYSSFIWFQICHELLLWNIMKQHEILSAMKKRQEAVVQHQPLTREPSIWSWCSWRKKSSCYNKRRKASVTKRVKNTPNFKEALLSAGNFYLQGISRYPHSKAWK